MSRLLLVYRRPAVPVDRLRMLNATFGRRMPPPSGLDILVKSLTFTPHLNLVEPVYAIQARSPAPRRMYLPRRSPSQSPPRSSSSKSMMASITMCATSTLGCGFSWCSRQYDTSSSEGTMYPGAVLGRVGVRAGHRYRPSRGGGRSMLTPGCSGTGSISWRLEDDPDVPANYAPKPSMRHNELHIRLTRSVVSRSHLNPGDGPPAACRKRSFDTLEYLELKWKKTGDEKWFESLAETFAESLTLDMSGDSQSEETGTETEDE